MEDFGEMRSMMNAVEPILYSTPPSLHPSLTPSLHPSLTPSLPHSIPPSLPRSSSNPHDHQKDHSAPWTGVQRTYRLIGQ